jgi:hypothetical protein
MVQIVRAAMLFSIVIYGFIKQLPSSAHASPTVYPIIALLAIWVLAAMFLFRRKLIVSSEKILAVSPEDPVALTRWRTGYLVIYAFSEAIALYGMVPHFMGFPSLEVVPFFVAGIALILFFAPRRPATS